MLGSAIPGHPAGDWLAGAFPPIIRFELMAQEVTTIAGARDAVAKKIRFLMRTETMTISQMADRIGVTPEHLKYVVDGVSTPTVHLLEKVCATFNVKLDFFGKGIAQQLKESAVGPSMSKPAPSSSPLPFTPDAKKRKAQPIGVIPETKEESKPEKKRNFDLAELAAHHQALLECLMELKILPPERYMQKLADVRERSGLT